MLVKHNSNRAPVMSAKLLRHCVIGLAALIASAGTCAWAQPRAVKSMSEMRQERAVVQEWDLSCGAAALATVLHYGFGERVSEKFIAVGMMNREEYISRPEIIRAKEGFSLLDMQRFVELRGFKGEGLGGLTLDSLQEVGVAIVPLRRHGYNHFVVFRGIVNDRVLIADPSFGTRTLRVSEFMRMWKPTGSVGRVAFVVKDSIGAEPLSLRPQADEFYTFA